MYANGCTSSLGMSQAASINVSGPISIPVSLTDHRKESMNIIHSVLSKFDLLTIVFTHLKLPESQKGRYSHFFVQTSYHR